MKDTGIEYWCCVLTGVACLENILCLGFYSVVSVITLDIDSKGSMLWIISREERG